MISIKSLNKTIQDKPILKDINVDIKKGRLTSIIGPNGAGKSTLLSIITRLTECDNGDVTIEGKALNDYKSNDLAKKTIYFKTNESYRIKYYRRAISRIWAFSIF